MSVQLILDMGQIKSRTFAMAPAMDAAIGAVMQYHATSIQDRMRNEAPWTDRTSNARNGLFARAGKESGDHVITAYHTVPYGIFLEVSRGGKYRVIMPTLETELPKVLATVSKVFGKL